MIMKIYRERDKNKKKVGEDRRRGLILARIVLHNKNFSRAHQKKEKMVRTCQDQVLPLFFPS
jgi:hypothetical protein